MLNISEEEFVQMKMIFMDGEEREGFRLLKEFLKRLEQEKILGLKSHLDSPSVLLMPSTWIV